MKPSRGILLLVFSSMVVYVHTLDLPNLGELFGDLMNSIKGGSQQSDEASYSSKDDVHSRAKRQNPDIGDESQYHYEIKTSALPTLSDKVTANPRYMPTLGNGHLAVTVFNDSMYMNGLFDGTGSESHRAKIPALLMPRITLGDPDMESRAVRKYILNAHEGYFMETIDCDFAWIEHKLYAHQKYIRTFVVDIFARRKDGVIGGGVFYLTYPDLNMTSDIVFQQPIMYYANWQVTGQTKTAEQGAQVQKLHVFWMARIYQISLRGSTQYINETMVMSLDWNQATARDEFDRCQTIMSQPPEFEGHYQLFLEHKNAWQRVWSQGRIEVDGESQLAKTTTFSQYYLLSSLPAAYPYVAPQHTDIYYGAARNSLAKGGYGRDYQGHVMWDNEIYILPVFNLFHPETVKKVLRYRSSLAPRANTNAQLFGAKGYHFPWESGFYGGETSREADDCPECVWRKYHVTGAVAWAIRQYYSATRDRDYMINPYYNGCDMTREIARFFADRAVYNPNHGRYDINNITGPDELHPKVDNNAYTLVVASLAIHWARYFACLCQRNEREEVPDEWIQKALYLNLPFDNVMRLHHAFNGFNPDQHRPVKQADTVLLAYPLNWNMSRDIMKNDLLFYETMMDSSTPAMTWSFFTVGFKWVNEEARMQNYFLKSYQDYLIQPFRIWTEFNERSMNDQNDGSVNFLPGMGGFLQSLVYGFAGIRIRPEMLEFHKPMLPPGATRLRLIHMNYLGANMSVIIENRHKVTLTVHEVGQYPLILRRNDSTVAEENLPAGSHVVLDNAESGFYIYTSKLEACEHPRDFIYMPWGYSPWVDSASVPSPTAFSTLLAVAFIVLINSRHRTH